MGTHATDALRLPLGQSGFAPYALAGGGYQFDMAKVWFGQVGGGIEYRFTRNMGVFLDARWVLPDEILRRRPVRRLR